MNERLLWMQLAASAVIVLAYEARMLWMGLRHPQRVARTLHARIRAAWVTALQTQPGSEIVAVQTLRNSLMSATITASTSALALMGALTLVGPRLAAHLSTAASFTTLDPGTVLQVSLVLTLFASYVCSAMAMRLLNHAGFIMSMPVGFDGRKPLLPLAQEYLERAGLLYSWGLRCFLAVAPLVASIVMPVATFAATMVFVCVLWFFDRPAKEAVDCAGRI